MKVPGSRVREIISTYSLNTVMSKRIKAFDKMKKGNLVLAILSMAASEVYLVEDAALKMPIKFAIRLKEKMEQKVEENALVLYITSTDQVFDRSAEKGPGIYKTKAWEQLVDHYKELYGTE